MTHFERIYETAIDNYGLITSKEARKAGLTTGELKRYVDDGRLEHRGHGVYRLMRHYTPTANDPFAEATALVGEGSYLYGESVLALHELAFVNPTTISVATSKRIRRCLAGWVKVVKTREGEDISHYFGIPSQRVENAIRTCMRSVMKDRLLEATFTAEREGLITATTAGQLKKEIGL